ncbi:MAG: hypothetical protein ACRDLS_17280 [Solirubrobacteraceae bacterium]
MAHRQERAAGIAEDRAEVFSLRERGEVPYRRFARRVLLTRETEAIERTLLDDRFYARGVGLELSGGTAARSSRGFAAGDELRVGVRKKG